MRQTFISLCAALLLTSAPAFGGVTLSVPEVSVAPGGTAIVTICFDLGTAAYTAYQFDIAYPDGIVSERDTQGNPIFDCGDVYARSHNVSSICTVKGLDRFQCFSINSDPLTAQSGTLLLLTVKAQQSLAQGTYQATIDPIEFVETDATPDRPAPLTFSIKVTNDALPTGISSISAERAAALYDLSGRRIDRPAPRGIYVRGGKKEIVK